MKISKPVIFFYFCAVKSQNEIPRILLDVNSLNHRLSGVGKVTAMVLEDLLTDSRLQVVPWVTSVTDNVVPVPDLFRIPFHRRWAYWLLPDLPGRISISHFTNAMIPLILPEQRAGLKVITVHDLALLLPAYRMVREKASVRKKIERAIRRAGHFVCVSRTTESDLLNLLPGAEGRTTVIYPHPGADFLGFSEKAGFFQPPQEKPYFLLIGNQNERKNALLAVEAWCSLPEPVRKQADLVLIGDAGNQTDAIREAMKGLPVKLLGYLPDEACWNWMAGARAVLAPAVYEGYGLQVQEALWLGTPVIASDIPVFRELFDPQAKLVPLEKEAWREALKQQIEGREIREAVRRPEIRRAEYGDLYLRLLNRQRFSRPEKN